MTNRAHQYVLRPNLDSTAETGPDYRFSFANERTYLAWIRTSLALVAAGIAAAKALDFNHEFARWVVAGPPILAGALLAIEATARWHRYENAIRASNRLPVGHRVTLIAAALSVYAVTALTATLLDH
jgi:putative membrane protein